MTKRLAVVLVLTMLAPGAFAADAREVTKQYAALADIDPDVRSAARVWLMALTPNDLPILRQAIDRQAPKPSQAAVLKQIVLHVLSRDRYQRMPRLFRAFLGVSLGPDNEPADSDLPPDRLPGVTVYSCMSGFIGERYLQVGDRILGYTREDETFSFDSRAQMIDLIRNCPPGTMITLHVVRYGGTIDVPLMLDAKIATGQAERSLAEENAIRNLQRQVQQDAEHAYAKLFGDVPELKDDEDEILG